MMLKACLKDYMWGQIYVDIIPCLVAMSEIRQHICPEPQYCLTDFCVQCTLHSWYVWCAVLLIVTQLIVTVCLCLQESEGGLYVCMNTFLGFGREHVERHYRKTGQSVYMLLKRHVKEVRFTPVLNFSWVLVFNGTAVCSVFLSLTFNSNTQKTVR